MGSLLLAQECNVEKLHVEENLMLTNLIDKVLGI